MKTHVVSLGGSLIVPGDVDAEFLQQFRHFVQQRIAKGERFILIAGGGKTCRNYQKALEEIREVDNEEKDWIGIHSSRLNAHLLRSIFKEEANPQVIKEYDEERLAQIRWDSPVLVGAGWKPGWSTDYLAVLMARHFGITSVINLSNISYVYDKDPRYHDDATRYERMNWTEFRKLVGDEWDPGLNSPFDPIASKEAQQGNVTVGIMEGKDLENLETYLGGGSFEGTIIQDE